VGHLFNTIKRIWNWLVFECKALGSAHASNETINYLRARIRQWEPNDLSARGFDLSRHEEIESRWRKYINGPTDSHDKRFDQEFGLAWLALKFRYVTADAHSERFHNYWLEYGRSPSEIKVYIQERELNGFSFASLSSIETGCYALYVLALKFDGSLMPSEHVRTLRDIDPRRCNRQLRDSAIGTPLAIFFDQLVLAPEFQLLSDIRNVSGHRTVMSRNLFAGSMRAELVVPQRAPLPLDENFTENLRTWVASQITEMLNQAAILLADHGA
jgi:hypothetical protein